MLYACAANADHGFSRSAADKRKRRRAEEAMQQHPDGCSLSEISQAIIPKLSEHDRMQLLAEAIGRRIERIAGKSRRTAPDPARCEHCPQVLSGMRVSRSPIAMDVVFELFDNELLITDDALHHIAN
jgi:hypothetical protein